MYDDRFEPDQLEQSHVLYHSLFQAFVHHGAAAVFHDNDLSIETLDIRQCLDQHLRLVQILLHILIHNILLSAGLSCGNLH